LASSSGDGSVVWNKLLKKFILVAQKEFGTYTQFFLTSTFYCLRLQLMKIYVHVKEKVILVQCGVGLQQVKWLGDVGVARYDSSNGIDLGPPRYTSFLKYNIFFKWSEHR
jgi:hypothetical protein